MNPEKKCVMCAFVYCHEQTYHNYRGCKDYHPFGKCIKCGKDIEERMKTYPTFPEQHLCYECWWKKNGIPGEYCPGR